MKKSKKIKIAIFITAILGLLVIYWVIFYSPQKRFNWSEDYTLDKDRPYGTWLISELLQHYEPKRKFITLNESIDYSLKNAKTPSNYVFIGQEIYLENSYTDRLLAYVEKGNNAFVFTEGLPWLLQETIMGQNGKDTIVQFEESSDNPVFNQAENLENYLTYDFDTVFTEIKIKELDALNPYRFIYKKRFGTYNKQWSYVDEKNLNLLQADNLGNFYGINSELDTMAGVNFYKVDYGRGTIFFHTQPLQFTNIQLLDTNAVEYANTIFSYLNTGPVYWDEYNWIFTRPTPKTWTNSPYYSHNGESPISLILNNSSLKWGWYLLLIFILIFVLFEGKRKQAVIAVLPDKKSTTLVHIKSLTKLYFKEDEHYAVALKMFENFLWYLHSELRIDTTKSPDKIIDVITAKSGADSTTVKSIFDLWNKISGWKSAKTKVFLEFYRHIDLFYNKK